MSDWQQHQAVLERNDLIYPDAARFWQDGHILGNGDLAAICYAPYGVEWTVNKTDVFDGRTGARRFLKDSAVRARMKKLGTRQAQFLNKEECSAFSPLSKSCGLVTLRIHDEYSWSAARPHKIKQRLALAEATDALQLDMHLSHPRIRSFVSAQSNVLAIRFAQVGAALWSNRIELVRPLDADLNRPRWRRLESIQGTGKGHHRRGGTGGRIWFAQELPMAKGRARYVMMLAAVPGANAAVDDRFNQMLSVRYRVSASQVGGAQQLGDRAWLGLEGNADIFVAVATSFEAKEPLAFAHQLIDAAIEKGFERLETEHQKWWRDFWSKSRVEFPDDPEVERSWYFSLYETGSLLRHAPVPGLFGLWFGFTDAARPGLGPAYTQDQNVQIPMMPVFAANHPELAQPFIETYWNCKDRCRRHTRAVYERPGICLPLTMNQLGAEVPSGGYRYSLIGGAYSGLILVWTYRFTQDAQLLRDRIYPYLREIVRFYVSWMIRKPGGRYRLDLMISPEIRTLSGDDIATLALLKPCLEFAIAASRKLKRDADERREWEDVLAHYPRYPTKAGQFVNGADIDRKHFTQASYLLYPIFPGNETDARLLTIAARTLDALSRRDIEISYADEPGRWHYRRAWALFFPTMTALRLGRVAEAWAGLKEFLRLYLKPNGLFSHDPVIELDPSITEANLANIPAGEMEIPEEGVSPLTEFHSTDAAVAATTNPLAKRLTSPASEGSGAFLMAATETLLQSHGGVIRVFPGLPAGKRARFKNLRAEGGVLVSAEKTDERVAWVHCEATIPVKTKLSNPWFDTGKNAVISSRLAGWREARIVARAGPVGCQEQIKLSFSKTGERVELKCA
ncbi:MAG: hypothetical protein HY360_09225 [Verrucomicrobia bacterium]|nr:hypothetical protein [Verrucomicrobiota bacterium]